MEDSQNTPLDASKAQDIAAAAPDLLNAFCPLCGLATGGQPCADHFRQLAKAGYRTVVDLRHPSEARGFDEATTAREAGLRYENIPVTPHTLCDEDFDRLRALLKDPATRPALVHCASANRVGALLIPYLILDEGKSPPEAERLAGEIGLRSPELAEVARQYVRTHRTPEL